MAGPNLPIRQGHRVGPLGEEAIVAHCVRHFEEPVMALCRTCGQPYCSRCLVFAFGPKKPPYCVSCALTASGVRVTNKAAVPVVSDPDSVPANDQRVERAARRAQKAAARAAAKEAKKRRGDGPPPGSPEPRPTYVPAPTTKNATSAQPV